MHAFPDFTACKPSSWICELITSKDASAASAEAFLATIDLSALCNRNKVFSVNNRFADMALDKASAKGADVLIERSTQAVLAGAAEKTSTTSSFGVGAGSPPSGTAGAATQSPINSAAGAIKLATDTQQAFVVGGNVIAFNANVTDDHRRGANRITPENVAVWVEIYYDTPYSIGWLQQGIAAHHSVSKSKQQPSRLLFSALHQPSLERAVLRL
jgi:hypothetical protein